MRCSNAGCSDPKPTGHLARREFLGAAGATIASLSYSGNAAASSSAQPKARAPQANRAPLGAQPYYLLPTGSIAAGGWLRRQLEIQAAGLTGHLDEIWEDVGPTNGWLGGNGESWERAPYYLDGLLPLAWLLDSPTLKDKAQKYIEWTLNSATPDGMFGPKHSPEWWPRIVMLKVLIQYEELTADPRVIPLMTRYFHHQLKALPSRELEETARARWQDEVLAVLWVYNRTGDALLLELSRLLKDQGLDWQGKFERFNFKGKVTLLDLVQASKDERAFSHGVNNAMALKASPLWSLISDSDHDRSALQLQLKILDEYHGIPIGLFSADEHLAGRNPSQGLELCAVVEAMFSLEHAIAIIGDGALADRLERIAYNALPAAFSDDMRAHQYDQQPNQIECSVRLGPWGTNSPASNLFGLAAHFGCCTANLHQGWPKLTASLWMATREGGLVAMIYAPCDVMTQVRGVAVRLQEQTEYPFRNEVSISVDPERDCTFPLKLRVPGWARDVNIELNGKASNVQQAGGFCVIDRTWRRGDRLKLVFDFKTRIIPGFNQSVSVEHGPLIFALPITEDWRKLVDYGFTANWEVLPRGPWNYAIKDGSAFVRKESVIGEVPFSRKTPAVTISVTGQEVPTWANKRSRVAEFAIDPNFAPPPPQSPVADTGNENVVLTLIPYAAAKLRITSFPIVAAKIAGQS